MKGNLALKKIRSRFFCEFNADELRIFAKLSTPKKIQDFIEALPVNFDFKRDTLMSPRRVLRENKAHCIEGALLAAAALWFHGQRPLLLDLKTVGRDYDHVVALFRNPPPPAKAKDGGLWGAISKTNHAVLRYREPMHRNVRELALTFFHEYFTDDGKKTMRSFSAPFDVASFAGSGWLTAEEDLWDIGEALDESPHYPLLTASAAAGLRRADPVEIRAGKITQWKKKQSH